MVDVLIIGKDLVTGDGKGAVFFLLSYITEFIIGKGGAEGFRCFLPFINEMVPDVIRWKEERVLSLMVQEPPAEPHDPTVLRVLDFSVVAD